MVPSPQLRAPASQDSAATEVRRPLLNCMDPVRSRLPPTARSTSLTQATTVCGKLPSMAPSPPLQVPAPASEIFSSRLLFEPAHFPVMEDSPPTRISAIRHNSPSTDRKSTRLTSSHLV